MVACGFGVKHSLLYEHRVFIWNPNQFKPLSEGFLKQHHKLTNQTKHRATESKQTKSKTKKHHNTEFPNPTPKHQAKSANRTPQQTNLPAPSQYPETHVSSQPKTMVGEFPLFFCSFWTALRPPAKSFFHFWVKRRSHQGVAQ